MGAGSAETAAAVGEGGAATFVRKAPGMGWRSGRW